MNKLNAESVKLELTSRKYRVTLSPVIGTMQGGLIFNVTLTTRNVPYNVTEYATGELSLRKSNYGNKYVAWTYSSFVTNIPKYIEREIIWQAHQFQDTIKAWAAGIGK